MDNTLIKDIPKSEGPRERLKKYGRENISNEGVSLLVDNNEVVVFKLDLADEEKTS